MTRLRGLVLVGGGAALLVLTLLALVIQWLNDLDWFLAVAGLQAAVYGLTVWSVWNGPSSRRIVIGIAVVAALMRLPVIFTPPYLSSDVYRYVWDGRVSAAGIDPYRYVPDDPRVAALRDPDVFPNINRANSAVTIYPPVAEAIFFAVTRVGDTVTAMKGAMVAFEIVTFILLVRLLAAEGLPTVRVLVYAWHPLPLWEFAGSGHIDAALIAFTVAALALARRYRPIATGLMLAAATLTKFFPAVLLPALYRRGGWATPIAFVASVILIYLPLVALGWHVTGFLPGYAGEEGFDASGAGFFWLALLRQLPLLGGLGAWFYVIAAGVIIAALAGLVFRAGDAKASPVQAAAVMAVAFIVLLSPHYAWYFAWLIVFAGFVSPAPLLWLTNACLLLYLIPVGSHIERDPHRLAIESMIYGPFAVLVLVDLWYRRRRAIRSR